MLQTLCDFFLLLSTNKKTITPGNILTFHQFITKKIPQIEIQYPSLIVNSLNYTRVNNPYWSSSNFNNNSLKYVQSINIDVINEEVNETGNVNESSGTKSKYKHNMTTLSSIQKDLLDLLYDMVDYFNEENLVNFDENSKDILKNRIENKIKENNAKEIANINNKYTYGNNYKKETIAKKIRKIETRNYVLELIKKTNNENNNKLFEINYRNFINFFNCKNKNKNRNAVILFVNIIRPIIKIYKESKKKNLSANTNNILNKSKTKSVTKFPVKRVIVNNFKNSNVARNNINPTDPTRKKIITGTKLLSRHSNNIKININPIENDDLCDDTIKCQTPKNISSIENEKVTTENNDNYLINNVIISNSGTEFKKTNNNKMKEVKRQNNIANCSVNKGNFKTFDNNFLNDNSKKYEIPDENIQNPLKRKINNINYTFDIQIQDNNSIIDSKKIFNKSNGLAGIKEVKKGSFNTKKLTSKSLRTANTENVLNAKEFVCIRPNFKKNAKEYNCIIEKNDDKTETEENTDKNEGNACFIY